MSHSIHPPLPVALVWSGHSVGFDFLHCGNRQYVGFYDEQRRMTVAARRVPETTWTIARPQGVPRQPFFNKLDKEQNPLTTVVGWDSHNSITLAVDETGIIHLLGNMHVDPLVYFRTRHPHDITSFERIDRMVGRDEDRCTYPRFLEGPNKELIFRYRYGRSGNGVDYYNIYDVHTKTWHRLLEEPLLDGLGRMNAYARMLEKGPDGRYHLIWVWRDTGDCATNHSLSYIRSENLRTWETGEGRPLSLPVTVETGAVIDPVPPGGGLLNGRQWLGFDGACRPVVSYTKYDAAGNTQAYCARLEKGEWIIYQISDWHYRWEFSGHGSIPNGGEVMLDSVYAADDGSLRLPFRHIKEGEGIWDLVPDTLAVASICQPVEEWPSSLTCVESDFPGMTVHLQQARGATDGAGYVMRWESLGSNRDRAYQTVPPPSELRVYSCVKDIEGRRKA